MDNVFANIFLSTSQPGRAAAYRMQNIDERQIFTEGDLTCMIILKGPPLSSPGRTFLSFETHLNQLREFRLSLSRRVFICFVRETDCESR